MKTYYSRVIALIKNAMERRKVLDVVVSGSLRTSKVAPVA
jgi:hypothetical protein